MPDEIRYTTRNDGPTRSRARLDTGTRALLVVPPATLRAASPEVRNRVAARAELPLQVIDELIARGEPVIVHRSADAADAARTQERLRDGDGVATLLLLDDGATLPGVALAASALGGVAWVAALALALLFGPIAAALPAVTGLLLFAAAAWTARAARARRRDADQARSGEERARGATRGHEAALTHLQALRDASLAPDLPVEAQVDLWRSVDALERAVLDGSLDDDTALARVQPIAATLRASGSDDHAALAELTRTARAITRARQDAGPGGG